MLRLILELYSTFTKKGIKYRSYIGELKVILIRHNLKTPIQLSTKGNNALLKSKIAANAPPIKLHLIRFSYNKSIIRNIIKQDPS